MPHRFSVEGVLWHAPAAETPAQDVFYFASLVGDTGNGLLQVNALEVAAVKQNLNKLLSAITGAAAPADVVTTSPFKTGTAAGGRGARGGNRRRTCSTRERIARPT